ncbi:MAG: EAL domain-containing protein [Thiohalocapsa sp.]
MLLLTISYHHHISDAEAGLAQRAERAYQEIALLIERAEGVLNQLATVVSGDEAEIVDNLQRAVYDNEYFREAGFIDADGFLKMTSLGPVDPPVFIPPERRSVPGIPGIQLAGPVFTEVMQERSIVLSLKVEDDGEVNLLVSPRILRYFLSIVKEISLGPGGFIAFVAGNGSVIVAEGTPPEDPRSEGLEADIPRIRFQMELPDGAGAVIGEISRGWVLRHWRKQAAVGVPLAFLSALLIFFVFVFFFRRTEAIDFDIRTGLKQNELELDYQPIVDINTGACVGSEALVRWRHPEEGVLLPALFIPAAEKTGLIGELGEWVLKRAVAEQGPLFDRFPVQYVSVNLSPVQLNSGSFDACIKWLTEISLPAERLVFEVTEEAMMFQSQSTALDILARAQNLGCRVALDDFGTGYSNLKNLTKMDVGFLKIDRHFVAGINQDIRTNSILEAIVELGHKIGVTIIAEGVETEEQRDFLSAIGVRYAQGWFFSRALPIHEFENFLSRCKPPAGTETLTAEPVRQA